MCLLHQSALQGRRLLSCTQGLTHLLRIWSKTPLPFPLNLLNQTFCGEGLQTNVRSPGFENWREQLWKARGQTKNVNGIFFLLGDRVDT